MEDVNSKYQFYTGTKENKKNKNLLETIFSGVALAMGVAIIVLNIVNPPSLTGATSMLGIGIAALGMANLRKA